ncbi:protein kinase protein with tetratricopeptiderepeat domain [Striga asiatica]|uniref:Protein kinase protein with tetratricopeptiderepeat domain n=1 Tax=Striga asiatica TaxID=4170 RepID=A0A5A7QMY2_STRAF|nr:protein kinase protein with tetratricopeptiderepeat domain [Striga asiatica]
MTNNCGGVGTYNTTALREIDTKPDKICRSRSHIAANKADLGRFSGGLQSESVVGSLQDLVPPSLRRAELRHASACCVRPLEIEPPNLRPSLPSTKREERRPPKRQCFHRSATIGSFRSSKIQLSVV